MGGEKMRKVLLAMIGLTAAIVAVFCSYSSAFGKPVAPHIPVAVAASPAVLAKLVASPALRVYQVRDLAVARSMVEDRAVSGGLVLTRTGRATLVVASGGGHAVEAVLVQLGQQAAGTALNTVDVAPTTPGDPNGSVEFYCVVFLGIGAAVGATMLARILGPVAPSAQRAEAAGADDGAHRTAQRARHALRRRRVRRPGGAHLVPFP